MATRSAPGSSSRKVRIAEVSRQKAGITVQSLDRSLDPPTASLLLHPYGPVRERPAREMPPQAPLESNRHRPQATPSVETGLSQSAHQAR